MGRFILKSVDWIFAKFCIYKESNMNLMQICVIKIPPNFAVLQICTCRCGFSKKQICSADAKFRKSH